MRITRGFYEQSEQAQIKQRIRLIYEVQVQDAGTQQGLNTGTLFSRSLRVPPIWNFFTATTCPRATDVSAASTIAG